MRINSNITENSLKKNFFGLQHHILINIVSWLLCKKFGYILPIMEAANNSAERKISRKLQCPIVSIIISLSSVH